MILLSNDPSVVNANTCGAGDNCFIKVKILSDRYGRDNVTVELPTGRVVDVDYTDMYVVIDDDIREME